MHGSLFEILQNKDLNANSWTNNQAGKPRGPFVQNQFGATTGGPIVRNKLVRLRRLPGDAHRVFGRYPGPGLRQRNATVPTPAMKQGDFSSLLGAAATGTDINNNPINFVKGTIYDPLSHHWHPFDADFADAVPGQ